jgi:hypothetical protein
MCEKIGLHGSGGQTKSRHVSEKAEFGETRDSPWQELFSSGLQHLQTGRLHYWVLLEHSPFHDPIHVVVAHVTSNFWSLPDSLKPWKYCECLYPWHVLLIVKHHDLFLGKPPIWSNDLCKPHTTILSPVHLQQLSIAVSNCTHLCHPPVLGIHLPTTWLLVNAGILTSWTKTRLSSRASSCEGSSPSSFRTNRNHVPAIIVRLEIP